MKKSISFNFLSRFENFISFGGGHITASLYCGDPPIIFDPGVSAFGPFYLKKIMANTAHAESLLLALSHAHFDHCGAAAYLTRKIPAIKVAASSRAAEILQRPNAVELIGRLNAEYEKSMEKELQGEEVAFTALNVDFKLHDDDKISLGNDRYCNIIETPGHTRDSISYFLPDPGVLVIGDAAGACENNFIHSPFLTSYENYIASIEKLQLIRPSGLCIAHNGILTGGDVPLYLELALTAAIEYKDMIDHYLDACHEDQEKVVQKITAEEYDAMPHHIQKRRPFILNLQAKVNAVAKLRHQVRSTGE
ncbi:MAG: MBL fold metallo-hydrolase [Pseudomonadota bacterium]